MTSRKLNLPGIVSDHPDVYETNDLPEADQNLYPNNPYLNLNMNFEEVQNDSINAKDAKNFFRMKETNQNKFMGGDGDDRVTRRIKLGLDHKSSPYFAETPTEKYERLLNEISDFRDSLLISKNSLTKSSDKTNETPQEKQPTGASKSGKASKDSGDKKNDLQGIEKLLTMTDTIKCQLSEFPIQEILGEQSKLNFSNNEEAIIRKITNQMKTKSSSKAEKVNKTIVTNSTASSAANIKQFDLMFQENCAEFSQQILMSDLEKRIGKLEAVLGNNDPLKMSSLVTDTGSRGLFEVVDRLSARTSLLDPQCVDRIDRQLALLAHKLQKSSGGDANAGKQEAESGGGTGGDVSVLEHPEQKRVAELYAIVKKWDKIADQVPGIHERLSSLQELHQKAVKFNQNLAILSVNKSHLSDKLKTNEEVLKNLSRHFEKNMNSLQSNLEVLTRKFEGR